MTFEERYGELRDQSQKFTNAGHSIEVDHTPECSAFSEALNAYETAGRT